MLKSFLKTALFLTAALPVICSAQTYQATALGAKAVVKDQAIEIQFYGPEIVRITKTPAGQAFKQASLSVTKKPEQITLKTSKRGEVLDMSSSKLKVTLGLDNESVRKTSVSYSGKKSV